MKHFSRRDMIKLGGSAILAGSLAPYKALANHHEKTKNGFGPVIVFGKHLQDLSYDEVAAFLEANDFDGIEATVRKGGQVEPENVERDLPKLVKALEKRGRKATMITTDIVDADASVNRRVIKVANDLGIHFFRMAYYRYKFDRPIIEQLEEYKKTAYRLGEYLEGYDVTGLYQNHAGSNHVGGSVWDLRELIKDIPAEQISAIFDVRHATVEGGLSWPVLWNVIKDRVRVVYLKDFRWEGRKTANVPLGTGQVSPAFIKMVQEQVAPGTPLSLHMEHISSRDSSLQKERMEAIAVDRKTLHELAGV